MKEKFEELVNQLFKEATEEQKLVAKMIYYKGWNDANNEKEVNKNEQKV